MDKNLKSKIEEIESLIRTNSKDAHYADTLLKELRNALKKDVPETELSIPSSSVISKIDGGSFALKECEDGILFHLKGGYDVFVKPRMTALYKHLVYILRTREQYDTLTEEQKQIFDATYHATIVNLEIPVFMMVDDVHFFEIAERALKCINEVAESALSAPLKPETPVENAEFENAMEAMKSAETN